MKLLLLDIETRPALGYVWSLWEQNVSLPALLETSEVICFAAKWLGKRGTEFYSVHNDGKKAMVRAAHRLLDECDAVVHYNGTSFDIPHLNREFLLAGLTPPSPYAQIDLFHTVRRKFNFISNKLEYVSKALGLSGKVKHEGFELWIKCMAGDDAAWVRMERYNKRDVTLLEDLYAYLKPWITNHPSAAVEGDRVCPTCGSDGLQSRGTLVRGQSVYQRYHCRACGKWSRGTKRTSTASVVEVPA